MLLHTQHLKEKKVEVLMQGKISQKEMMKTGYATHYFSKIITELAKELLT